MKFCFLHVVTDIIESSIVCKNSELVPGSDGVCASVVGSDPLVVYEDGLPPSGVAGTSKWGGRY